MSALLLPSPPRWVNYRPDAAKSLSCPLTCHADTCHVVICRTLTRYKFRSFACDLGNGNP